MYKIAGSVKKGFWYLTYKIKINAYQENGIQGATLKSGLYQYFINHKGKGQIIIVDNLNVMLDIDLQATGTRVTT